MIGNEQEMGDQIDSGKPLIEDHDVAKKSTDEESSMIAASSQGPAFSLGVSGPAKAGEVDVTQLENIDIIRKGLQYSESLQLEKAVQVYDEGVRRFPNDTVILDAYTDLLLQLDQQ